MSKNPFPATLEVERELYYSFDYSMIPSRAMFPAPLEVDRYLYLSCEERMLCLEINCFRPLSRQIGSYTNTQKFKKIVASSVSGPSRGRQVSIRIERRQFMKREFQFPAPLEVDRYLYTLFFVAIIPMGYGFPSPLEVDREL